jgi:hypothetical protein
MPPLFESRPHAEDEIACLWQYLADLDHQPLPFPTK